MLKVVKTLWLTLNLHSETPLYMQIRNQIIEGILVKELKPGEELPSVRQLASDLEINMLTVNKAYTLLKQENFIQIHRQKGAVINPAECYKADEAYMKNFYDVLRPLVVESFCRGISKEDLMIQIEQLCHELKKP